MFKMNPRSVKSGRQIFLRAGLPFIILMGGGAYILSYFTSERVKISDSRKKKQSIREFDLEEEYKAIQEELRGMDDYKIVKIPRPDEKN
mmetsp:Transcript_9190/g.13802  ORF Transcript_9190/g.13802 Transcript_9190/m.13802 type:complete len:89 (+) Transcript_9190:27-293(+)